LSKRRWFGRVWTYQESLLAEDLLVIRGKDFEVLHFSQVGTMATYLHKSSWRRVLSARFSQTYSTNPNKEIFSLFQDMAHVSEYIQRQPVSQFSKTIAKSMSEEEWIVFWRRVCLYLRLRACTFNEDRIRASFGIASILRPAGVPEEIFKETVGLPAVEIYR
jgi:hypothetical protein